MPRGTHRRRRRLPVVLVAALAVALITGGVVILARGSVTRTAAEPAPATPAPDPQGTVSGTDGASGNTDGVDRAGSRDPGTPGGARKQKVERADSHPVLRRGPLFFLVLGSDARSKQPGTIARGRADSIHIVALDPVKGRGTILGFPRDAWVQIPGHGMNKINDAMYYGGPAGAVAQMEEMTGIDIDFYVLSGFYGFRDMVTAVGGVRVRVPYDMNDPKAKIRIKEGLRMMGGKLALEFNRARYSALGGDFGRSENQGIFLISMLEQFRRQYAEDPSVLLRYLAAVNANVQTDMSFQDLTRLAFTATQVDPAKVTNRVVTGSIGTEGSESVVNLSSSAQALYRDLEADGYLRP